MDFLVKSDVQLAKGCTNISCPALKCGAECPKLSTGCMIKIK